jgi:hypothetical protein
VSCTCTLMALPINLWSARHRFGRFSPRDLSRGVCVERKTGTAGHFVATVVKTTAKTRGSLLAEARSLGSNRLVVTCSVQYRVGGDAMVRRAGTVTDASVVPGHGGRPNQVCHSVVPRRLSSESTRETRFRIVRIG